MRTGASPPPVVADKRGNPMHSWRTLILPHMEQGALYRTYNFGEPWNGPDNGKLTSAPLRCYCCPSDPSVADRPMTSYVAVTGPGTVWDEHHLTVAPPRVIVFEVVDSGIQWAEPRDMTLDEACHSVGDGRGPRITGHNSLFDGFFVQTETTANTHVLLSDRSVRSIPPGMPPEILGGLFVGDEKAWKACDKFPTTHRERILTIYWTNCVALAVLIVSYAVLVLRAVRPVTVAKRVFGINLR